MKEYLMMKDKLKDIIGEYAERKSFSPSELEAIKNAAKASYCLCECIKSAEDEYSNRSYGESYRRDRMDRYSSDYSRDNYSRGGFMEHLEEMAHNEPDERKRREYTEFVERMKRM